MSALKPSRSQAHGPETAHCSPYASLVLYREPSAEPSAISHELYRVIRLLERERVHYRLDRHRDDSIMVTATLVGERIEIDVFEDRHIEYSRFRGNEDVEDDVPVLEALLRESGKG